MNIDKVKNMYLPTGVSTLRAVVAAIPMVGGSLDHLLFDKRDEIRFRNTEKIVHEIQKAIENFDENKISKDWFNTEECLQAFKLLLEKTQFEAESDKIKNLAKTYVSCGSKKFEKDPNKLAVIEKVAQMTYFQQNILKVLSNVTPEKKSSSGGGIMFSISGIWSSQIETAFSKLKNDEMFWKGNIDITLDLEILETFNLLKSTTPVVDEKGIIGYNFTRLGRLVCEYLDNDK